jgi:outer membrane protein assembly factor BamB
MDPGTASIESITRLGQNSLQVPRTGVKVMLDTTARLTLQTLSAAQRHRIHDRLVMRFNPLLPCFALLSMLAVGAAQPPETVPPSQPLRQTPALEWLWQAQSRGVGRDGGPVFVTPHVSVVRAKPVFEVVHGNQRDVFAPHHIDRHGAQLGVEGARRQADIRMRVLQAQGVSAELEQRGVPDVVLYLFSAEGILQAIDGETGQTRWATAIGHPGYPSFPPAANDRYVAALNGSTLYVVDAVSGKLAFDRPIGGIPGSGPALTADRVFVPFRQGLMTAYPLNDEQLDAEPLRMGSFGHVVADPVVTPVGVAWSTDRGYLYVADTKEAVTRYRIETRTEGTGSPAFRSPDQLFLSSRDGYLVAVNTQRREPVWEYLIDGANPTSPLVTHNSVLVASNLNLLFCIDPDTGQEKWRAPGIHRVIGFGSDRLYATSQLRELVVLDARSGQRLDRMSLDPGVTPIPNPFTDRVYLLNGTGRIECLRPAGSLWPEIHLQLEGPPLEGTKTDEDVTPRAKAAPTTAPAAADTPKPRPPEPSDEPDHFGEETREEEDPFGEDMPDDDPFGELDEEANPL